MKKLLTIILITVGINTYAQNTPHDLSFEKKIVYLTLLAEARGEGDAGIYAVACVIEQRSRERNKSLKEVCLQPAQFSCWNSRSFSDLEFLLNKKGPIFDYTLRVVNNWDQVNPDVMKNSNHYHADYISPPYWAKGQTPVRVIKNHIFYKL